MRIAGSLIGVACFVLQLGKIIAYSSLSKSHVRALTTTRTALRMTSNIKLTTYNVLSSHLSEATHFTACKPEWLDPAYRLKSLKNKLDAEVQDKAVICLQEVSHKWAGALHPYFAARGYHLITACYGAKFNGYMGVAVAVPTSEYDIMDVDVTRVSDTKRMQRKPKPGYFQTIFNTVSKFLNTLALQIGLRKPSFDFWDNVLYRTNQMICVRLKGKGGEDKPFVVGTYHMPCMFRNPSVMVTHCALSAQHIQRFAKADPCVYVGDFNIKPGSSMYQLITEGDLDAKHEDYPPVEEGDNWKPALPAPLRSAYVTAAGAEPDFTNYAKTRDEPVFIETLDYIFHSENVKIDSVQPLPLRDTVAGPLPNESEPSDHILMSARISVA